MLFIGVYSNETPKKEEYMNTKLTVTDRSFQTAFIKYGKAMVLEFFASWCPHCQRMVPILDTLAQEYEGKVSFLVVDVDQSPLTSHQYGVGGVPMFMLIKNGKVLEKFSGGISLEDLRHKIENKLLS